MFNKNMVDGNIPGIIMAPQSSTNITPPAMIQQEFLKWINQPEEVFLLIEHNLRGDSLTGTDPTTGADVWTSNTNNKKMNDRGIQATISQLRWYIHKFNLHADYTPDEINTRMLRIAINFRLWFATMWRSFDVSPSDFYSGILAEGIIDMIDATYRMSGLKNFYAQVLSINQGQQPQPQQQRKVLGIIPWPF
jgi:hypothetical protein